ncbi:protein obstructor-E-like [Epargyreus clarus]|uniref:protein obstructor-E-like n=1 Tax=Epargyreus clarus TaxID=520877 RepID=UPI003C2DCBE9
MAFGSSIGIFLSCLVVLANSAEQLGRRPVFLPARTIAEAIVEAEFAGATELCPEDGFFADPDQCDKYTECRGGKLIEKLCPDGLVFNDVNQYEEKCEFPFNYDCSDRPNLQPAKPSRHCPRQNGYFPHEDSKECAKFYFCADGQSNMITCPDGLVYNEKTGACTWPDEAKKEGCGAAQVLDFECPKVNVSAGMSHPRYADPLDCQYYYVCVNGNEPRRAGCKLGQVFDDDYKRCDWARNVPPCADWYKDQLTEAELEALEHPPRANPAGPHRQSHRPGKNAALPETS